MSDYEQQVVSLIKFKAGEYEDRQDYLASLIRATDKWLQKHDSSGDIFDGWDNELASWFDEAVHAMNGKKEIPDFPDAELGEEDSVPEEAEDTEVDDDEVDPDDAAAPVQEGGDDPSAQPVAETAPDESIGPENATDNPPPDPIKENKENIENKPRYRGKTVTRYDNLDGKRDRFGVVLGTKTADAVALYEKGTTAKEIEDKIGGRHYNILKNLAKKGHRILKQPGGGFKLIHRDDLDENNE